MSPLHVPHIAAICSSLRYGCAYDEISLATIVHHGDDASEERGECWRWIAFAVFHPRSKRFAVSFRLRSIDLSGSHIDDAGMRAFSRTLANPVAELRGATTNQVETGGTIIICELMQGSTIYSQPTAASEPLLILDHEQSWEALHKESDTEWLNVVVPGHGLGWVQVCDIKVQHQELLVKNKRIGLVVKDIRVPQNGLVATEVPLATSAISTLIANVGDRLRSLDIVSPAGHGLHAIYQHCSHLEHLSVANSDSRSIYTCGFLEFFQSRAAWQLTSLDLRRTQYSKQNFRKLTKVLKNPRCLPRLREVRLINYKLTEEQLARLSDVLRVRKTLVLVELRNPRSTKLRKRFDAEFHNELVSAPSLLLPHKLALIIAITNANSSRGDADKITERWIFE